MKQREQGSTRIWAFMVNGLERLSKWQILALSAVLVVLLGYVDRITGFEVSFSIFYLIPIVLAAWFAGERYAIILCAGSAAAWLLADLSAGHVYSHALIPFWNTVMRFAFFVFVTTLVAGNRRYLDKEKLLARTDPLTSAVNSRLFLEAVREEVRRSARYGKAFTLAYMDIDDFKSVNDSLGHGEGDRLLETTAAMIRQSIRGVDLLARLGGDEFSILFPETDQEAARSAIEKLRCRLINMAERQRWPVSFSFGVLTCSGDRFGVDDLITMADKLMYKVKKSGKNAAEFSVLS